MVVKDGRGTYEDIQVRLKISTSAVNTILHNPLGLREFLSHFEPHKLIENKN